MLDVFIGLLISLLILSIITEKFSTLIRSYPMQSKWGGLILIVGLLAILWFRSPELLGVGNQLRKLGSFALFLVLFVAVYCINNYTRWSWGLRIMLNATVLLLLAGIQYSICGKITSFFNQFFFLNAIFFGALVLIIQSFLKRNILRNINKGFSTNAASKENEISVLSIAVGILVAFLFHADLIQLFEESLQNRGNLQAFSWGDSSIFSLMDGFISFSPVQVKIEEIAGITITGFFLSFGSRFFHDLLESLFEAKNYRRNLNRKQTFLSQTSSELNTRINISDSLLTQMALDNTNFFNSLDSRIRSKITAKGIGFITDGGLRTKCIQVNVKDKSAIPSIPTEIPVYANNEKYPVPIKVVYSGEIEAASGLSIGTKIGNDSRIGTNDVGTFSCFVKDVISGRVYGMSCYHVLKSKKHKWDDFQRQGGSEEDIILSENSVATKVGTLTSCFGNQFLDIGLFELEPGVNPDNGDIADTVPLDSLDDIFEKPVRFRGINSKTERSGFVANDSLTATVSYTGGFKRKISQEFENLFAITKRENGVLNRPTEKGDSGSLVYDLNNKAMGIIIAQDSKYSYAIAMTTIQEKLGIKLYKS